MKNSHDQLKIEFSQTDKESKSVRLICVFLVLFFVFVPLAEFVTDIDYYHINYQTEASFSCFVGGSFEPLSFKAIK